MRRDRGCGCDMSVCMTLSGIQGHGTLTVTAARLVNVFLLLEMPGPGDPRPRPALWPPLHRVGAPVGRGGWGE